MSREVSVSNFPRAGRTLTLRWQQAQQNFVITRVDGRPDIGDPGEVLFSEDYEAYATGTLPSDYIIVYDGQGTAEQRIEAEGSNRHLRTAGQYYWSLGMHKNFDFDLPQAVSVSWRMRVDNDVNPDGFYTSPGGVKYVHFGRFGVKNADEIAAGIEINKLESDRKITAMCSADNPDRHEIQLGVWTEFRMDIDFVANRVSAYADGKKFCEWATWTVNLSSTWNDWGDPAGILFASGNSGSTVTRFDDIEVRATGPPIEPLGPPARPTNLRVTASGTAVTLRWDAVAGTGMRYVVYQHYGGGRHWAREVAGTSTTFYNMEAGGNHCFDVVAVNPARQESAPSARQCARTVMDDIPPSFGTARIADQQYRQHTAISALTLPAATGGTAPLRYSLSPALPAGLRFDAGTRRLTGTPTAPRASTVYTYTATDANGATATLTFRLSVQGGTTGFAPADQAAWSRLVVGKRVVNAHDSADYYEFSSTGRFTYYFHGDQVSGTYSYRKTGPNTAAVTVTSEGGITCTYEATFTSATTGTAVEDCTGERIDWRII